MTHAANPAPTDTGLFGPDSVTWRIHVDPAMWIAAFSALALQSLHPRTMWGTYQNSALFRRRTALPRLYRTADYVATRTFGTSAEVDQADRRIRSIHRAITGIDEDTGVRFPIDDEENLRWVHCAEVYPYLRVARASGIELTSTEADPTCTSNAKPPPSSVSTRDEFPGRSPSWRPISTGCVPSYV